MGNRLLLKSSGTADAVPDFDDLELAELVVNTRTGKLYCKTYDGVTYAIVDLSLSSPDEIIASGQGLIGQPASGGGPCALLSGTNAVALLPAASGSNAGIMTAEQYSTLFTAQGRPRQTTLWLSSEFRSTAEASFQDVTGMTFPVAAEETVRISGSGWLSTNADIDHKMTFGGPAGATLIDIAMWEYGSGTGATNISAHARITAYGDAISYNASSSDVRQYFFGGIITNGPIAGTIALRLAKLASGVVYTPIINAGSWMDIYRCN